MAVQNTPQPKPPISDEVPTDIDLCAEFTIQNRDEKRDTDRSIEIVMLPMNLSVGLGLFSSTSSPDSNTRCCRKSNNHGLHHFFLIIIATTSSAVVGLWDIVQRTRMDNLEYRKQLYPESIIPPHIYKPLIPLLSSPATLVLGVTIATASLTTYRYLHRHDKHQVPIMMAFLAIGVVVGKMIGLDNIAVLLQISPWPVILGLLASTVSACSAARRRRATTRVDVGLYEKA